MSDRADDIPQPVNPSIFGDPAVRTLFPVQAFHSAGEGMFALSLVGSLFFNVSVDAARPQILLYLALTMAPFAVLAPLIGPIIDRLRGGHRGVLLLSLGGRAVVALLLASQLKTLLLYPEAFVIVVLAKVFSVGRNALIPSLVTDRERLVMVNSRLARLAATAGVLGAVIGLGILQIGDAGWVLRAGAVCYALGAVSVLAIPGHQHDDTTSPIVESTEMHGPGIQAATIGMAGLRFAAGFLLFHVGFALKTSGQPTWIVVAVLAAASIGGFGGTFIAPRLSQHWREQRILTAALMLPAGIAAITALRFHGLTAIAVSMSLGAASSVGRRAFDSVVQTEAPHARRGQAYAWLETRLEIAWVIGSLLAVLGRFPNWLGLVILSACLGALSINRILTEVAAARVGAEVTAASLPMRLMETAEAVAAQGDRQQAVLVALAAAEAAAMVGTVAPDQLSELKERSREAAIGNDLAAEDDVLRLAHDLVAESTD